MNVALYQLADDPETYGHYALGWVVVTPDAEDELTGPFKWREDAERYCADMGWTIVPIEGHVTHGDRFDG